jgi:gamma-glutamylcyclotransferase (GGCT)/AIG2-like uncharacterized protein YtfP
MLAATVPTYKMTESSLPVVIPDPEGKPLAGEVYAVADETLARLDQLEREGSSYDRKLIDITLLLDSDERLPTKAFIYVGREDRFGKPNCWLEVQYCNKLLFVGMNNFLNFLRHIENACFV